MVPGRIFTTILKMPFVLRGHLNILLVSSIGAKHSFVLVVFEKSILFAWRQLCNQSLNFGGRLFGIFFVYIYFYT